MPNTKILKENGQEFYPVTHASLIVGMENQGRMDATYAWDGTGTPDITKIPAGVVVTYDGTSYTGTLAASADTAGRFYLVPSTTVTGEYDRYLTDATGSTITWKPAGTTAIPTPSILDNVTSTDTDKALSANQGKLLKDDLSQLEAKVDDLSTGKYYGYFAKEEDLPEADVDGFAYVGEGPTYTIYNLRGGVWTSSDITVNQSPIGNDEDIDQNEDGKLQFANRVYNAQQPNGMGYKILRKDATFASQVTDTNTIYEIRYDFDLGGAELTIPNGCVLKFNGGIIKNGKIIGNFDVVSKDFSEMNSVETLGFNIFGRERVYSNEIGMIPNEQNSADRNNKILQNVIDNCKQLVLTDTYYIRDNRIVTDKFSLEGGKLIFIGSLSYESGFIVKENASLSFKNVTFESSNGSFIVGKLNETFDYVVEEISFVGCQIINCRAAHLVVGDILYSSNRYGVKRFVVQDCYFSNTASVVFKLDNLVVTERFLFKGNYAEDVNGIVLYLATTNGYSGATLNRKYQCDFVVEDNVFIGKYNNVNDSYTPVTLETNRVFFRRNIIKNFVVRGAGFAYDAYITPNEYYFENNYIKNVCNLPETGTPNTTPSQLFFSKGVGINKVAKNNLWEIDFDELRELIANEYNVSFTDAQFSSINFVTIFGYTGKQDNVEFCGNTITIKGGRLSLNTSQRPVVRAVIEENYFNLSDVENILLPFYDSESREYFFRNNYVNIGSGKVFKVFSDTDSSSSNASAIVNISGNKTNVLIPFPTNLKDVVYHDNMIDEFVYQSSIYLYPTSSGAKIDVSNIRPLSGSYSIIANGEGVHDCKISFPNGIETNTNIISRHSNTIRVSIPLYKWSFLFDFFTDSQSWQMKDESGVVINSGDLSGDTQYFEYSVGVVKVRYKVYVNQNNRLYLQITKSGTSPLVPFVIEFLQKPNDNGAYNQGLMRFDPTLGKPTWWNGTAWVDATGTAV